MRTKSMQYSRKRENLAGYAFVGPALVCYLLLVAFPFCLTIILSFTEFNFLRVRDISQLGKYIEWIGLENFVKAFSDRRFVASISNTFVYAIATVPASILLGIVLAYALNGKVFCKTGLRLAFFIPYISSVVAVGAVFNFLFREDGLVNNFLQFKSITLPMVSPTTFYLVIVRLIAVFKIFGSVNVFTMGSSITSNTSMVQEIYTTAFANYQHGYASAQSVVLLVIIVFFTAVNFAGQKKWVHY